MTTTELTNSNPNNLIFGLEDNPPFQTAFLVSLQHVCVVFVPSVTPAILIGRALNLDAASISYIIGMTLEDRIVEESLSQQLETTINK